MYGSTTYQNVSLEYLMSKVSDWDIFKHYNPSFKKLNEKFKGSLRSEENASAIITQWRGKLWYKDFGDSYKGVDWIDYVRLRYNMPKCPSNLLQVVALVYNDLMLGNRVSMPTPYVKTYGDVSVGIEYAERKWDKGDKAYWYDRYKINSLTLKRFNIVPISHVFFNDKCIPVKGTYCYDKIKHFNNKAYKRKIYSPLTTKPQYKWTSNTNKYHIQGLEQLPSSGKLVILEKSLKDIVCLYQHLGIPAIAMPSESTIPFWELVDYLRNRFDNVVVHLDNDAAGIRASKLINFNYGLPYFFNPIGTAKDNSDFIHKYGVGEFKEMFNNKLRSL